MINEAKEIKDFENEKKTLEKKISIYQTSLSDELTSGNLGEEMKYRLKNPIKLNRYEVFKLSIKHFIDKIFEVL